MKRSSKCICFNSSTQKERGETWLSSTGSMTKRGTTAISCNDQGFDSEKKKEKDNNNLIELNFMPTVACKKIKKQKRLTKPNNIGKVTGF